MSAPLPIDDGGPRPTPGEMLAFERRFEGDPRAKETAIRSQLGISAARYYRILHRAIDDPAALAEDPLLVRRLQRIREGRSAARAARIFPAERR